MSIRLRFAIIIPAFVLFSVFADDLTVTLSNGTVFKGALVSENANFITLSSNGANVKVLKSIISTINGTPYKQGEPVSAPSAPPAQTKTAEPASAPASQPQPAQPAAVSAQPAPAKPGSLLPGTQHTVALKNGTKFSGTLVTENANFMTFNINTSKVNILKSIIADIDGLPFSLAGVMGAAAPPPRVEPSAPAPAAAMPQTKEEPPVTQKAEPVPIKPIEQPKAVAPATPASPTVPAPAAVIAPTKPEVASVKQDTVLKTKPAEKPAQPSQTAVPAGSGKPTAEATPVAEPAPKPDTAGIKPDTSTKAQAAGKSAQPTKPVVSNEAGKPKTESALVQEPSPKPATLDTIKKPGAQQSTAPVGKSIQPAATVVDQKSPTTPQTPGSPGYGPMAPLPVNKRKPASEWTAQSQTAAQKANGSDTTADAAKQTVPVIRDTSVGLNMASFTAIDKAIQDAGASETYRRMAMAIHAESHAATAAPALPKLIELLGDNTRLNPTKKEIKAFAADTLAKFTPALMARKALVAIGEPAVKPLIEALSIRSFSVRAHSAWILGEIKDPRCVEPLLGAVKDSSFIVRTKVSEALGKIRDPRSIPLLLTLLEQDTSGSVKTATQTALNNLTDIPTLIQGLKDPHTIVKDNAAYILFLMTAQDFRSDPSQWEIWWKKQQEQPADTTATSKQVDKKESAKEKDKTKTADKKAEQKKK
jgi:hypothetical protein